MAKIKPFKSYLPGKPPEMVATKNVAQFSKSELEHEIANNPNSFLQIVLPDYLESEKSEPNSIERFKKVRLKFDEFKNKKVYIINEQAAYYIYEQQCDGEKYIGIMACCSIDDYKMKVIKPHEQIISAKSELLCNYLQQTHINAEPVAMFYEDDSDINQLIKNTIKEKAKISFTYKDGSKHRLWTINNKLLIEKITSFFDQEHYLYIADGHHRTAASDKYGELMRKNNPAKASLKSDFFMSILFAESQIKLTSFNRVVKNCSKYSFQEIEKLINKNFHIELLKKASAPTRKQEMMMYTNNAWYKLHYKCANNEIGSDSELLTNLVLNPIFGIEHFSNNRSINFIPGSEGEKRLEELVDNGSYDYAFSLFPIETTTIKEFANQNKNMPAKSTWVLPKLLSGLLIYETL